MTGSQRAASGAAERLGAIKQALERWRGGKYIPVGRVGLAWEMGPLAVWLASDGSAALNGETIAQDGGGLSAIGPTGWAPVVRLEEPD